MRSLDTLDAEEGLNPLDTLDTLDPLNALDTLHPLNALDTLNALHPLNALDAVIPEYRHLNLLWKCRQTGEESDPCLAGNAVRTVIDVEFTMVDRRFP